MKTTTYTLAKEGMTVEQFAHFFDAPVEEVQHWAKRAEVVMPDVFTAEDAAAINEKIRSASYHIGIDENATNPFRNKKAPLDAKYERYVSVADSLSIAGGEDIVVLRRGYKMACLGRRTEAARIEALKAAGCLVDQIVPYRTAARSRRLFGRR